MSQEQIQVPKGWTVKKISEVTKSFSGGTPSTANREFWENGTIPWLRSGKLKDKIITSSDDFITEIGLKKSSAKLYPPETVLVAITGATTGKTALLKMEACGTQNVFGILPCDEIIPTYLWYYMRYYYTQLLSKSIGGAQGHVNGTIIKNTPVKFPVDKQIQKKIVQKLDDILRQLEEKKKMVFSLIDQNKEKIGFFEKNWISYVIDNDIEKHPKRKEWSISTLAELPQEGNDKFTDGPFGSNLQVKDYTSSGIPIIRLQNIGVSKFIDKNWKFTSEKKYNELIRHSALPGDVLIAKMAEPVARSTIITPIFERYMPAADCVKLRINEQKAIPEFVSYAINSYSVRKQALSLAQGMTRLRINLREIKKLEIPLPPIPTQKQIVQNIKNAEEKFKSQKSQFENIKENYENSITYVNHIQSSILDVAFSGKLVN